MGPRGEQGLGLRQKEGLRGASWGARPLPAAEGGTAKQNIGDAPTVAMSSQVNARPVPSLVLGMRTSCLARGTPAWRIMLVLRELFEGWQREAFRRWHAHATPWSIMRETFDVWQVETFRMYRGAMKYAPTFLHAWRRWFQLARGLGWARHRPARMRGLPHHADGQGLSIRRDTFDVWQLETFRMHRGAMKYAPTFLHAWRRRFQLALASVGQGIGLQGCSVCLTTPTGKA